jgi:exopolysaccharide production protein ExoY
MVTRSESQRNQFVALSLPNNVSSQLLNTFRDPISVSGSSNGGITRVLKRLFDASSAIVVLVLLLPLLVILLSLILATQGRPVFFAHKRIGRNAATFKCLKFRTMVRDADKVLSDHLASDSAALAEWQATRKLRDDPRITPIGKILRRSSLDEIPQLINIIKGDMSVVGPRPIVQAELKRYGSKISAYYKVRPGLTGLWQISGRNDVSYEQRVNLDYEYTRSQSFIGDLKIIAKTIPAVVKADGSY